MNSDVVLCEQGSAPALPRSGRGVGRRGQWTRSCCSVPLARALGYDGAGDFFRHEDGRLRRRGARWPRRPSSSPARKSCTPGYSPMRPAGTYSLNRHYDEALRADRLFGLVHRGVMLHVGSPAGLEAAERYLLCGTARRSVNERAQRPPSTQCRLTSSFVDALGWRASCAGRPIPLDRGDPLALSRLTILLPTRRACRALSLAFLRAAPGRALLLPRIRPAWRHRRGRAEPRRRSRRDPARRDLAAGAPAVAHSHLIQKLSETPGGAALTGAGACGPGRAAGAGACRPAGRNSDRSHSTRTVWPSSRRRNTRPLAARAELPRYHHGPQWPSASGGAGPDGPVPRAATPCWSALVEQLGGEAAGASGDRRRLHRERAGHARPAGRHRAHAPGCRRPPRPRYGGPTTRPGRQSAPPTRNTR